VCGLSLQKTVAMKYYEGNAPCPGCGRTGNEMPRKGKDCLCDECMAQLQIGRAISKERGLERNFYKMDDIMGYQMTWYTIHNHKIEKALCHLLHTFSQFEAHGGRVSYAPGNDGVLVGRIEAVTARHSFVLPKETFDAARELCQAVKDVASQLDQDRDNYRKELNAELDEQKDEIYNAGIQKGRNLLFQLNAGAITPDDFAQKLHFKKDN